jgi:putative hydrolase of the HAD superfamily
MIPSRMLAAVLFDFGGVLYDMRWDVAHELAGAHGLPRGAVIDTLYRTEIFAALERGRGDPAAWRADAHHRLERLAARPLPPLHEAWRARQGLVAANVELARALRPAFRTAILSNADLALRPRLHELGVHDAVDAVICSAEEGIAKPEAAIYHRAAARLGLAVEACVFVDDHEPNVAAARALGMTALRYRLDRADDLGAMLAELGVRPARPRGRAASDRGRPGPARRSPG